MAISIKDLTRDLTTEDVLADLLELAKALGLSTTAWQPGESIHTLLSIVAEQLAKYWNRYIVKAIRGGFLDHAEGVWLTLAAMALYGVFRGEATFATGKCKIENQTTSFFSFVPGDIRIKNQDTNKTYLSTAGGILPPWSGTGLYPTLELDFQADEIGSDSSAATGQIAAYPTALATGPAGVFALTNSSVFLGEDEESDDSLRKRARLSTGPLSPAGSRAAYEFIALSTRKDAAGNPVLPWESGYTEAQTLNVTRVRVADAGQRTVKVWLASPSGGANGDNATEGTDVFIVNVAIQRWACPVGITAQVSSAIEQAVTWTVTVYVDRASNVIGADAKAAAENALAAYASTLPIGGQRITPGGTGFVFSDEVKAKASESSPGIFRATMTGGDVALADVNRVAVPTITVTATVVTQ